MCDLRASVERASDQFERVARHAKTPLADRVRGELARIAKADTGATDQDLADRAAELARMRAYVIDAADIEREGRQRVAELEAWGVPADITVRLATAWVPDLTNLDDGTRRVALYTIYEQYDYWEWYVETYTRAIRTLAITMIVTIMLALAGGGVALTMLDAPIGAIAGGAVAVLAACLLVVRPRAVTALAMRSGVAAADVVPVSARRVAPRRRLARGSTHG